MLRVRMTLLSGYTPSAAGFLALGHGRRGVFQKYISLGKLCVCLLYILFTLFLYIYVSGKQRLGWGMP